MGLLSGLEKFGLEQMDTTNLFEDEKKPKAEQQGQADAPKEEKHLETEFLLLKSIRCPVCDHVFRTRLVKTGRVKRLEPDFDLRPRFAYIDTNKYDVSSCPKCGYTAINRYFSHITSGQVKLIDQGVHSKFKANTLVNAEDALEAYTYEEAIEYCKLALYCTMVKKGSTSEKAYECLKLSWLYRGWREKLESEGTNDRELLSNVKAEEDAYYKQAYEGFMKAIASESFPMCGMEESTVNILLANMAFKLEKYDVSSKLVSAILTSRVASRSVKDRAMTLKEEIIKKLH
ncbi:MAG: DUF2225 domain-containing protein [Lachnospiraceae bacterium]|nr:DUF2225 domain-containing protein [Lachnospiraceae bacterium]MDD7333273.1 DUF2225 domain-containing protein [Lachnospiraceae bacterium]MDY3276107.1 DUF2225 domain-containing protein [Agathobacter sp.]MDY5101946.1 DUF2225 domain-containing protein [Agathobacter sp.]MDY5521971.1 DUF2225 domain-containing protein [Agathobacter sp.]